MTGSERKLPIVEIVIFVLVVIGAVLAWNTRASRATTQSGRDTAQGGWASKAAPPTHHRPTLSRDATDHAEQLCLTMVRSQLEWRTKRAVASAEATDRYEIGDLETGAGQRLIVEGRAKLASGAEHAFKCSMMPLTSNYGSPEITLPDLQR